MKRAPLSHGDIMWFRENELNDRLDYYSYISSIEWQWFREYVLRELGRRCAKCSATDCVLQVHHLHYDTLGFESLNDVQVLCVPCHKEADHERRLNNNRRRFVVSWPRRVDRWATERWGRNWVDDHHPEEVEQQFARWRKTGRLDEEEHLGSAAKVRGIR